jgi:hypothetical protein
MVFDSGFYGVGTTQNAEEEPSVEGKAFNLSMEEIYVCHILSCTDGSKASAYSKVCDRILVT